MLFMLFFQVPSTYDSGALLCAVIDYNFFYWWSELSREDGYVLYCKCSIYILSMLEGFSLCYPHLCHIISQFLFFIQLQNQCNTWNFEQVVKPLLQERTRNKVQVLPGCGRDELLKVNWFSHSRVLWFFSLSELNFCIAQVYVRPSLCIAPENSKLLRCCAMQAKL